jgi:hypothetical protein
MSGSTAFTGRGEGQRSRSVGKEVSAQKKLVRAGGEVRAALVFAKFQAGGQSQVKSAID